MNLRGPSERLTIKTPDGTSLVVMGIDSFSVYTPDFEWNGRDDGYDKVNDNTVIKSDRTKCETRRYMKLHDHDTGLHLTHCKDKYVKISGSANKLTNPQEISSGFGPINYSEVLFPVIKQIKEKTGLDFDINTAKLNRADSFLDMPIGTSTAYYLNEISKLNRYKKLQRVATPDMYGGGYIRFQHRFRGNETAIYDKIQEMLRRGAQVPEGEYMRIEQRALTASSCRLNGLSVFNDLNNYELIRDNWKSRTMELINAAKDRGLHLKPSEYSVDFVDEIRSILTTEKKRIPHLTCTLGAIEIKKKIIHYSYGYCYCILH